MTQTNTATKRKCTGTKQIDALVGKFFHTTEKCPCGISSAVWQGQILAAPSETHLLVQLYEWLGGDPNGQRFVALDEFIAMEPILYEDNEEMNFSYEHGAMRPRDHNCPTEGK